MFSNTAYEALYQFIGLELHSRFIELITSETFFKGLILIVFGVMFFLTLIKFISKHIPGSLVERHHLPLSRFTKIIAYLFLGLAILRVGTTTQVNDYQGKNWADNSYVQGRFQGVTSEYKVSAIFQLMSRTAEEITALLSRVIDGVFVQKNSQLKAPNYFYKAIMYAGVSSITDPNLRDQIQFYTDECFSKVIPAIERDAGQNAIDRLFRVHQDADRELNQINLDLGNGKKANCLEVKESVNRGLLDYAMKTPGGSLDLMSGKDIGEIDDPSAYSNYAVSMYLVNYYLEQKEGTLGVQKGAETPGTAGTIFHTLNRFFSWDGILGAIGLKETQGAAEVAKRSQEFSEHLARAPHVAGFIKMLLIALFPWLMFFVVAGRWKILIAWFWIYFSVLMWTPLWTLLYHVMLGIATSGEVLQAFGNLHDGISLYSAAIVNSRLYYMFSIYAWLQLLIASLTTGSVVMFLKPMLSESESEKIPEFLESAESVGGVVSKVAAL
jgi:hypothetical protein